MPTGYLAGLDPPTAMPRARPNMAFADLGGAQGQPSIFADMLQAPPQNGGAAKPGLFDDLIPEAGAAPAQGMFDDLIANPPGAQIATQTQQTTPQRQSEPSGADDWKSFLKDLVKSAGIGAVKGTFGLAGLGPMAADYGTKAADAVLGTRLNQRVGPYAQQVQKELGGLSGNLYQPKTRTGQYAQTIGEFVPTMFGGPEGFASRLITRAVAPGVASEAAGEATQGTAAEPYARFGAALLGGGVAGAGLNAAGLGGRSAVAAPTEEELETAAKGAGQGYNNPAIKDLQLSPAAGQDLSNQIKTNLLAKKVDQYNGQAYYDIADRLQTPRFGPNLTIDDLDTARQDAVAPPATATPADKRGSQVVKETIDNYLNGNIPEEHVLSGDADAANAALAEARGNFAAMKRSQDVTAALGRAENQAGSTYSGHNLDNATRQQLRPILNQKTGVSKVPAFQDYTQEEIGALKSAVNGSFVANRLRDVSKMLASGGGIGHTGVGLGTAFAAHEFGLDPMTSALLGVGTMGAGRMVGGLANRLTAGQVNQLGELLRSRSPLYQQQVAATPFSRGIPANIPLPLWAQAAANAAGSQ